MFAIDIKVFLCTSVAENISKQPLLNRCPPS